MVANTSNASKYGGSLMESNAAADNSLLNTLSQMHPDNYTPDINALDKMANQQALINGYQSKAAEMELDPNLAATRKLQGEDMRQTYEGAVNGNIPTALRNQFLRAGLTEGLNSTGNVGAGTAGLSTTGNIFGKNFLNYQNQIRQMASQYLGENPLQSAGLDPSSALNLTVQGKQNAANNNNAFKQNLGQAMAGIRGNQTNLANSMFGGAVQEGNSNAAAKNALTGAWINALATVAGSATKAAAMCWVAEELYGKDAEKTHRVRALCMKHLGSDSPFGNFCRTYLENGRQWAEEIKTNLSLRGEALSFWNELDQVALTKQ